MEIYSLEVFADYFLIYVGDGDSDADLSALISNESQNIRLVYTPNRVGIFTARNMSVPLTVEKLGSEPDIDLEDWDHVIECSISLPSGSLLVAGASDYLPDATRISAQPGIYRLRIFYGGLDTVSQDGLDGNDKYRIVFWPAKKLADITLLKS